MADYKLLITAQEVIDRAFPKYSGVTAAAVTDELIVAAQEKFIKPVLNGLFAEVVKGRYPDLLDGYIKAPLAHYVRLLLLPRLAYSVGNAGISTIKNGNLEPCGDKALRLVCRTARCEALALIKRAVDHIEENETLYSEYDPKGNILNKVGIVSGFVL